MDLVDHIEIILKHGNEAKYMFAVCLAHVWVFPLYSSILNRISM